MVSFSRIWYILVNFLKSQQSSSSLFQSNINVFLYKFYSSGLQNLQAFKVKNWIRSFISLLLLETNSPLSFSIFEFDNTNVLGKYGCWHQTNKSVQHSSGKVPPSTSQVIELFSRMDHNSQKRWIKRQRTSTYELFQDLFCSIYLLMDSLNN